MNSLSFFNDCHFLNLSIGLDGKIYQLSNVIRNGRESGTLYIGEVLAVLYFKRAITEQAVLPFATTAKIGQK